MSPTLPSLFVNMERRLAASQRVQFRKALGGDLVPTPSITLSRAFGCEAFPLAEHLKEVLDRETTATWTIYDRTLLEAVAQNDGISLHLLKDLGNPDSDLDALGLGIKGHVTHQEAFEKLAQRMRILAQEGGAIIIGRGAPVICGGLENCYHFLLEAGEAWRTAHLAARLGSEGKGALEAMRKQARHRDRFFSGCLEADIADLRYYDAIFNNEHHSVRKIAAAIAGYLRQDWPGRGLFR